MKKWVRNILKGTSLSTALFIFQACYGMPIAYDDINLDIHVVDGDTNNPIPDADVMFKDSGSNAWMNASKTDKSGQSFISILESSSIDLKFKAEAYQPKDTTIIEPSSGIVTIKLFKEK